MVAKALIDDIELLLLLFFICSFEGFSKKIGFS